MECCKLTMYNTGKFIEHHITVMCTFVIRVFDGGGGWYARLNFMNNNLKGEHVYNMKMIESWSELSELINYI